MANTAQPQERQPPAARKEAAPEVKPPGWRAFFGRFRPKRLDAEPTLRRARTRTQTIELSYSSYEKIFKTSPENLQERKDLSEDFFESLEKTRSAVGKELEVRVIFPTETMDTKTERAIASLYKENYEDDVASLKEVSGQYRKKAVKFAVYTGSLILALSLLELVEKACRGIFESLAEKSTDLLKGLAFMADRTLYEMTYVAMLLVVFEWWHLIKNKPDDVSERMKETERRLRAKLSIITKEDLKREKRGPEKVEKPQPQSQQPAS